MPISLRVLLIFASILTTFFIASRIRKSRLRLLDGFVWFMMSLILLIISIFPQIVYWLCRVLGITSPVNLVYLVMIFLLLMICFYSAVRISALEARLAGLAQEVAIRDERFLHLETSDDKRERVSGEKEQKE